MLGSWIKWADPAGKPPCDWWGINYYSRVVLSWWLQVRERKKGEGWVGGCLFESVRVRGRACS